MSTTSVYAPGGAYVSVREMFTIGIGPSASHTVGPMRAARLFAQSLPGLPERIDVALCGSLGATGRGHGTPGAVIGGLLGWEPETCDPAQVRDLWQPGVPTRIALGGGSVEVRIEFTPATRLRRHANAIRLSAAEFARTYYSIGGGFVVDDDGPDLGSAAHLPRGSADAPDLGSATNPPRKPSATSHPWPFAFTNGAELVAAARGSGWAISRIAAENERAVSEPGAAEAYLDQVWQVMARCIDAGLHATGCLPGGLGLRRRASGLRERLESAPLGGDTSLDWLQAFAMAVNEQNAAGERVVSAPTNGAAGIVPAVGAYYLRFVPGANTARMRDYLLVAGAIGSLCKTNASISGAEVGCQGEVGTAAAMAAGGLCELLGGSPAQVENAAEIAIEHHLGLTCDPIGGLVQVPCIERNSIAAATAVRAARTALYGDGAHVVSLDAAIETMRQVGADMSGKYKETATGGLALNVVEC